MADKDKDLNELWVDKVLSDALGDRPRVPPRHRYHKHIPSSVGTVTRFYFASYKSSDGRLKWFCPYCEMPLLTS